MIEVIVSIDVKAEPETAFAFVSEWSNNPKWQLGMKSCTWTSQPGSIMRVFNPLTKRMVERNVTKDYERLRHLLDEGA